MFRSSMSILCVNVTWNQGFSFDFPDSGCQSQKGERQPIIRPKFQENRMEMKKMTQQKY